MESIKFLKILFLSLVLLATCYAQTPLLTLDVKIIQLEGGGKIEFKAIKTDRENPTPISLIGQSESYHIYVGQTLCEYNDQFGYFKYELFVKKVSAGKWYCFELIMTPYGQFTDHIRHNMVFTINDGITSENGEMSLPLHSLSNDPYLDVLLIQGKNEVALKDTIVNVKLGSEQPLPFNLKNNLKDIQLVIQRIELNYNQPDYWTSRNLDLNKDLKIVGGQIINFDELKIRPRPIKVIPNIFFRLKSGEDTQLKLKVSYTTQGGGRSRELISQIRVQFVPSLSYMLLAILLGALLGSTSRMIFQKQKMVINTWFGGLVAAFLGAIILELIGILLVSCDSEFKIFGLVLNPFQFLHVMVLATLIGLLGVNIADLVKKLIGIDESKA